MGKAMAQESIFVEKALAEAKQVLRPPLIIERGAVLLYEITVDNNLRVTVNPKRPIRGDSAFQTDLCVFELKPNDIKLPRVVLEFKASITTHDIVTYSAKARKHKQVYRYLRYGLVVSNEIFGRACPAIRVCRHLRGPVRPPLRLVAQQS
jgi:hypothetical protein